MTSKLEHVWCSTLSNVEPIKCSLLYAGIQMLIRGPELIFLAQQRQSVLMSKRSKGAVHTVSVRINNLVKLKFVLSHVLLWNQSASLVRAQIRAARLGTPPKIDL